MAAISGWLLCAPASLLRSAVLAAMIDSGGGFG
jgi:hypothetical protein